MHGQNLGGGKGGIPFFDDGVLNADGVHVIIGGELQEGGTGGKRAARSAGFIEGDCGELLSVIIHHMQHASLCRGGGGESVAIRHQLGAAHLPDQAQVGYLHQALVHRTGGFRMAHAVIRDLADDLHQVHALGGFAPQRSVQIQYDPAFVRGQRHVFAVGALG